MDNEHPRHPEIHYHFLTFLWVLASGPLYRNQWAPFRYVLPPAQTSSCATGWGPRYL